MKINGKSVVPAYWDYKDLIPEFDFVFDGGHFALNDDDEYLGYVNNVACELTYSGNNIVVTMVDEINANNLRNFKSGMISLFHELADSGGGIVVTVVLDKEDKRANFATWFNEAAL